MTSHARARSVGFTLIEMLVVLVILALITGLLIDRLTGHPRLDLHAAADHLATTLREARGEAIAGDRTVGVVIDPEHHVYAMDGGSLVGLPAELAIAVFGLSTQHANAKAIRFAPDGSASGGVVNLRFDGREVEVAVDWLTGQVSMRDAP
jgi:general secretion pathway protein H